MSQLMGKIESLAVRCDIVFRHNDWNIFPIPNRKAVKVLCISIPIDNNHTVVF